MKDELGRTAPSGLQRDDPTSVVLVLNRDLMFGSRIANVVRELGLHPRFVKTSDALATTVDEVGDAAVLVILDMNMTIDWTVITSLTGNPGSPPMLGFGPHVDVEGRRAAKAAGLTRIVPNGDFHKDMKTLIGRYARGAA